MSPAGQDTDRSNDAARARNPALWRPGSQKLLVSYAQNFEDVLLHRIFGNLARGFYVDIGASDPMIGSVTKIFYDRGWSGINIEPSSTFPRLAAARPRDVNL